ncbi:MAG: hypothetical protein AAF264_02340 [Pseudomonadota bacterium]
MKIAALIAAATLGGIAGWPAPENHKFPPDIRAAHATLIADH